MARAASTATQKAPTRTTTRKTKAQAAVSVDEVDDVDTIEEGAGDPAPTYSSSSRNLEIHQRNTELFTLRDRLIKEQAALYKKTRDRLVQEQPHLFDEMKECASIEQFNAWTERQSPDPATGHDTLNSDKLMFAERQGIHRFKTSIDQVTADIVEENYGLVKNYVKKFTSNTSKDDSEDFLGAGLVGLMRAIDTYRVNKGKFGSWAFKPIQREVLRAVRDHDHPNMSHSDFESRPDILRAFEALRSESGDEDYIPTNEQVAERLGVKVDQVKRVLDAPRLESLNNPVGDEGDATMGDLVVDASLDVADAVLSRMEVDALERYGLTSLDAREMFVLSRRFGLDCEPEQRLSAIGEILGLSREAVRQVESKALAKMQHPVTLRKIARQGRA